MDVIAKTVCVCYSVSIETLKVVLGLKYHDVLFQNLITLAFRNSQNFKKLSGKLIKKSWPSFKVFDYNNSKVVIEKGTSKIENIIIIIEGGLKRVNIINPG